jgi:hypothetical protein
LKLLVVNVGSNEDISRNFWIRIEISPDPKHCQRCLHPGVNPINYERLCTRKVEVAGVTFMESYRTVPYSLLFCTGGTYFKRLALFLRYQAYGVLFYFLPVAHLFRGPSRAPMVQVPSPQISRCSRQN